MVFNLAYYPQTRQKLGAFYAYQPLRRCRRRRLLDL